MNGWRERKEDRKKELVEIDHVQHFICETICVVGDRVTVCRIYFSWSILHLLATTIS